MNEYFVAEIGWLALLEWGNIASALRGTSWRREWTNCWSRLVNEQEIGTNGPDEGLNDIVLGTNEQNVVQDDVDGVSQWIGWKCRST